MHLINPPIQIHVLDGGKKVHIYSRNAEDMTPRYPDIVSRLPGWLQPGTTSIVLDGEAVAWDPDRAKILPFQVRGLLGVEGYGRYMFIRQLLLQETHARTQLRRIKNTVLSLLLSCVAAR